MSNSVAQIARKDISKYIFEVYKKTDIYAVDKSIVTPDYIFTKESSRLNRELSIHKINKSKKYDSNK